MLVRLLLIAAMATTLVASWGCGGIGGRGASEALPPETPKGPSLPGPGTRGKEAGFDAALAEKGQSTNFLLLGSTDRLIVRTVSLAMLVRDVSQALDSIASLARDMGGFVVSSQIGGDEENRLGSISLRVPTERTDDALAQLRSMAVRVESERTSAQDVTEEYVDLQARLKNLQETEQQYLNLLKRAETVEDILKVQRELSNVQGQVEQLKGRMQYLERTSATSIINVELRPATSAKALVEPGWSPLETAKDAVRSLSTFGQGLVNVAIVLGIFAPVWVPLAVGGWFGARWIARLMRVPPKQ